MKSIFLQGGLDKKREGEKAHHLNTWLHSWQIIIVLGWP
jgi:hypothetical protein